MRRQNECRIDVNHVKIGSDSVAEEVSRCIEIGLDMQVCLY